MMAAEPRYPCEVQLSGEDGNAFAILGRVRQALREAGASQAEVEEFLAEATAGDYQALLAACYRWVEVA